MGWGVNPSIIECPMFVYQGALDQETPMGASEFHAKIIPGAELIVMPKQRACFDPDAVGGDHPSP